MDYHIIAKFDDGYYSIRNSKWIKCDSEGNVLEKEFKMTREEAIKKVSMCYNYMDLTAGKDFVKSLEALGLIKFEEEKKPSSSASTSFPRITMNEDNYFGKEFGVIGIEKWPEGLVIWVGGKIVYKSWEEKVKEEPKIIHMVPIGQTGTVELRVENIIRMLRSLSYCVYKLDKDT